MKCDIAGLDHTKNIFNIFPPVPGGTLKFKIIIKKLKYGNF